MDTMKSEKLLIKQGKRKWYELVLGSLLYSIILFFVLQMLYYSILYHSFKLFALYLIITLKVFGFIMPIALSLTVVKDILINTKTNRLETIFSVGLIKYQHNSAIPKLDYISVFKNSKEEFEVNLWYATNKHYNMYTYESFQEAFLFGKEIATRLNLDLLDATEKGDFKWVDKQV
jgi:hypothetical protein